MRRVGKNTNNIDKVHHTKYKFYQLLHALARKKTMFENVNIDWNLSHDDGSTDFSDEETLEDHPRTLTRTPEKKGTRPMSIYTPGMNGENEDSPDNNRSHGSSSDWSRSNTSDSGDSPGSYRNSVMPPPPPPQSKKPSICKSTHFYMVHPVALIHCLGFSILSCGC